MTAGVDAPHYVGDRTLDEIEKERETSDDETAVKADVLTINPDDEQNQELR